MARVGHESGGRKLSDSAGLFFNQYFIGFVEEEAVVDDAWDVVKVEGQLLDVVACDAHVKNHAAAVRDDGFVFEISSDDAGEAEISEAFAGACDAKRNDHDGEKRTAAELFDNFVNVREVRAALRCMSNQSLAGESAVGTFHDAELVIDLVRAVEHVVDLREVVEGRDSQAKFLREFLAGEACRNARDVQVFELRTTRQCANCSAACAACAQAYDHAILDRRDRGLCEFVLFDRAIALDGGVGGGIRHAWAGAGAEESAGDGVSQT